MFVTAYAPRRNYNCKFQMECIKRKQDNATWRQICSCLFSELLWDKSSFNMSQRRLDTQGLKKEAEKMVCHLLPLQTEYPAAHSHTRLTSSWELHGCRFPSLHTGLGGPPPRPHASLPHFCVNIQGVYKPALRPGLVLSLRDGREHEIAPKRLSKMFLSETSVHELKETEAEPS